MVSRNHLRRGYGGQGERKGRKGLNHEIHRIHGNGRARWSHRNPLSFVVRRNPLSSVLRRPSCIISRWLLAAVGKSEFGVCGVVGGMMVIELLAGAMRRGRVVFAAGDRQ